MKRSQNIFIGSVVALLIVSAGYYYFYQNFLTLNQEVSDSTGIIAKDTAEQSRILSLRNSVKNTQNDKILLDTFFVPKENVADFLQSIENLADQSGVTHTLSVGTQSDGALDPLNREWLTVTVSTTGSFDQTIRFLSLLESMPVKSAFSTISINTVVPPTKGGVVWTASIAFKVIKTK